MPVINYIAQRKLVSGHTVNNPYSIEFALSAYTPVDVDEQVQKKSLSGYKVIWHKHSEIHHRISADYIPESEKDLWKEFLFSVSQGESFSIDLTGSISTPGEFITCTLQPNSRQLQPKETFLYWMASFIAIELQ